MKELKFAGDDAQDHFEIVYDGLLQTPRGFAAPTETRVVSSILDKLEEIAKPEEISGPGGRSLKTFRLNELDALTGASVLLENAEYSLLTEALKEVKWLAGAAKKATAAMDWLEGATDWKPKLVEEEASGKEESKPTD